MSNGTQTTLLRDLIAAALGEEADDEEIANAADLLAYAAEHYADLSGDKDAATLHKVAEVIREGAECLKEQL